MGSESIKKGDLNRPVTVGVLLEYTDEFLLPNIGKLIEESEGRLKHELKEYIDRKLADYTSDIFKRLDKKYQKEKQFKEKVVELFKKHQIGSTEDLAYLEGLVQGS